MNDPFRFSNIAFTGREFVGPYSSETIVSLTEGVQGLAVDVGCGKGAVLRAAGLRGVGIDLNTQSIEAARTMCPGSDFYVGDARSVLSNLELEPDLVINIGASQAIGSQSEALAFFSSMLKPGGHLLFGDGVWDSEPNDEYLNFLGARRDEIPFLDAFLESGSEFGLRLVRFSHSTQEDWDSFEDHYFETMIRWCDENPNDDDSVAFRERMIRWRQHYLTLGRGVLGFAIALFEKA